MKITQNIRIKGGRLEFPKRSDFLSDVAKMRDGEYLMTIERRKSKRSLSQNAYYWGVIIPLVKQGLNDVGYKVTTEATHEYLKGTFNIVELINENTGEVLKSIGSTTEMSTSKMMDYFASITQWAAEFLNIQIPEPNEQLQISI